MPSYHLAPAGNRSSRGRSRSSTCAVCVGPCVSWLALTRASTPKVGARSSWKWDVAEGKQCDFCPVCTDQFLHTTRPLWRFGLRRPVLALLGIVVTHHRGGGRRRGGERTSAFTVSSGWVRVCVSRLRRATRRLAVRYHLRVALRFCPSPLRPTSITPRLATAATICVAAVDGGSTLTGRTRERTGVAPHVCAGLPISPDGRLDPTNPSNSWKPPFVVGRFRLLHRGGTGSRQNHRVPWSALASNPVHLAPCES